MKPMWILELAFLLLPVSLVAEASPEENHPASDIELHAYRTVSSTQHGNNGTAATTDAHPVVATAQDAAKQATVKGRLIEGGLECPLFQTDDGKKFSLMVSPDTLKDLKIGDRVELTYAYPVPRSNCMQDVTVSTVKIRKAD